MTLYESLVRVSNLIEMRRQLKYALDKVKPAGFDSNTEDTISNFIKHVEFELDELEIPYD